MSQLAPSSNSCSARDQTVVPQPCQPRPNEHDRRIGRCGRHPTPLQCVDARVALRAPLHGRAGTCARVRA
eukprot:4150173-Pleurochrysis_carterae.AAC.1